MSNVVITLVIIMLLHSTTHAAYRKVPVFLRVEGADKTIFEAVVLTVGHSVTTVSGGTHICDGTNNNASLTPGATATGALDTASHKSRFTWDG